MSSEEQMDVESEQTGENEHTLETMLHPFIEIFFDNNYSRQKIGVNTENKGINSSLE